MQRFKPGDRVIFLNEKGGGIVTGIVNDDIVNVSGSDGFEIPYPVKELLKSRNESDEDHSFKGSVVRVEEEHPGMSALFSVPNKTDQLPEGVYLFLVPENQEELSSSRLEIHLANHSEYQLLYSFYKHSGGAYHGIDFGYVDPDSRLLLGNFTRNEASEWANGLAQLVFYMDGKTRPPAPVSVDMKFKPLDLYQDKRFSYEGLMRKKAMVVPLARIDQQIQAREREDLSEEQLNALKEKIQEAPQARKPEKREESFLDKHKVDDKIAEVDLHIGELVESSRGMSNMEILRIQTAYFIKCLDQGRVEKLSKIIFIHGIGNGTLKTEIHRYLRQTGDVDFYDAPYARYGQGATEVRFFRQKV